MITNPRPKRIRQVSYLSAEELQQKTLTLINRHLDQLLEEPKVAQGSALTIQNYAKTLVILATDQRNAAKGFNPSALTIEELEQLEKELIHASSNETSRSE
jgi:hypothetical protein